MSAAARAVLLAAALAGCRSGAAPRATDNPAEAGLAALAGHHDISGAPVELRQGPVVVVVFASWCGPCRRELATLSALRRELGSEVQFIGLNAYEEWGELSDGGKLRRFLEKSAPWLTVVRDDGRLLAAFGGVPKIPSLFVYDSRGRVVRAFRRNRRPPPTRAELAAAIEQARAG